MLPGPACLPLLEDVVVETWGRRGGGMLTLQGYQDTGGGRRALAERAEKAYESLDPQGQAAAKRLLLRLVQPGEGTEDTRRREALSELPSGHDRVVADAVVQRFVRERLLTTSAA